ncbi:unnamed protein product [Prorocentrum cordatum]|uniref:Leucine zipper with capping helix domain-containing protein n=1 Tax=Prorocentrum cordatum TaxID=2364126 RepID=A0ABN9W621_9DINO|nr:unnamed protein product [Polarella glacialis]
MREWLDQAAKENEQLDEETRAVMQELATARRVPEDKTQEEKELEKLESLIKEWDSENETGIDEFMRRMTAIAFRKAIRREGLKGPKSEDGSGTWRRRSASLTARTRGAPPRSGRSVRPWPGSTPSPAASAGSRPSGRGRTARRSGTGPLWECGRPGPGPRRTPRSSGAG